MARPGRPERNRAARSFRQLRRFHHVINSDKAFGTHKPLSRPPKISASLGCVSTGIFLSLAKISKILEGNFWEASKVVWCDAFEDRYGELLTKFGYLEEGYSL